MTRRSPSAILTMATLAFLVVLFAAAYFPTPASGVGGIVGGRTKIQDVKTNQEVQELGKYSVKEYNRSKRGKASGGGGDLTFKEVVEAEKQVVSGIKYYLKVAATDRNGISKTFDAVVVVKAWEHSEQLLTFNPSPKN
ncbi:cysteine proteinase inhibitor B-like [Cornus florida]|uniref:cysteine proteinase inhibitor B-like n=1 Tax=Cornus florida TaxID=4283 RepID=UPI002898A031|nr:cysteine proteinase inhibitor B-like [Cornus florida]